MFNASQLSTFANIEVTLLSVLFGVKALTKEASVTVAVAMLISSALFSVMYVIIILFLNVRGY